MEELQGSIELARGSSIVLIRMGENGDRAPGEDVNSQHSSDGK
jgi:hypothetical protein